MEMMKKIECKFFLELPETNECDPGCGRAAEAKMDGIGRLSGPGKTGDILGIIYDGCLIG